MATSRRRFLVGAAAGALAANTAAAFAAPDEKYPLLIGGGEANITPPLDVGILTSSGRRQWAPFETLRLPIFARAVFLGGERPAAIVSLDVLGVAGTAVGGLERFKRRVAEAAGGTLQSDQIFLTCTHCHNGPETIALTDLYQTEPFRRWVNVLEQRVGEAIARAIRAATPCRLAVGSRAAPELCANRRVLTDKGLRSHRRIPPGEKVIGPEGPVEPLVRAAAFLDRDERPAVILVGATAHPVYESPQKQISPDYPGEMGRELVARHPGTTALFLQGATGNVNPASVAHGATGAADAADHGRRLADVVDEVLKDLQPVEASDVAYAWKVLELPAKDEKGQPIDQPLAARIGALRIGRAAFVFLPGEPFVEIGLGISAASPWPFTLVNGYCEDYIGYIPTDGAFQNGGYETGPGLWSRVRPGSEAIVRQGALELLRSL